MYRVWLILSMFGYYATIIFAGIHYDLKASALVILACCCSAGAECMMEMLEGKEG